jgi:hypothetical protein
VYRDDCRHSQGELSKAVVAGGRCVVRLQTEKGD